MCKAPVSAILCLPLEWHVRETPVSPRHAEHAAAAALKQQSPLSRVMLWWDKFCTHILGTKALKLKHSHIISLSTRFTVSVSFESQLNVLFCSPFWDPHCQGQGRSKAGEQCGHAGEHSSCTKQTRTCHCTATNDKGNLREFKAW